MRRYVVTGILLSSEVEKSVRYQVITFQKTNIEHQLSNWMIVCQFKIRFALFFFDNLII